MSLSEDVDLEEFITAKGDLSGADIKAVCTEAGLLALRECRMQVTKADFTSAREKVCWQLDIASAKLSSHVNTFRFCIGRMGVYPKAYTCNPIPLHSICLIPLCTNMNINSLSTVSAKPVVVLNLLCSQPCSPTLSTHCNSSFNILPFFPNLFCRCHCIDYDQPPTPVGAIPLVTLWLPSIISIQAAQLKNHFSPCLEKPTVDIGLKFHAPRLLHVKNN